MNPITYYHGVKFSDSIQRKLASLAADNCLPCISDEKNNASFVHADCFCPDGTPVIHDPKTIYPCYTANYLGIPLPESFLSIPKGYCTHASVAAYQWLQRITPGGNVRLTHFDGESFDAQIDGEEIHFAFPTTQLLTMCHPSSPSSNSGQIVKPYAVLPWPDIMDNDDDWEDGSIPQYAAVQAHLLLWCWWYSSEVLGRRDTCPVDCYIVRIKGNIANDCSVRIVHSDPPKQEALVRRIVRCVKGKADPAKDNMKIRSQGTWFERKQTSDEEAYRVEDPAVYALVRAYMEAKTRRSTLEAQSNKLKEQMDALAIKLAAMTDLNSKNGFVSELTPSRNERVEYTVTHTLKAVRPSRTVPAELVVQFFPEYANNITKTITPRGSVTVEAI